MRIRMILGTGLFLAAGAFALTREEAVARARKAHPNLVALQTDVEGAQQGVISAGLRQNPELSVAPGVVRSSGGGGAEYGFKTRLGISQTFEYPGKRALRVALAEGDVRQKQQEIEIFRHQLDLQVRQAFLEALASREELSAREDRQRLAGEFWDLAQRRQQAGQLGDLDALKARAEWNEALVAREEGRQAFAASKQRLAGWLGNASDTSFVLEGSIESDTASTVKGDPLERALRDNPAMKQLELRIAGARTGVEAAKLAGKPDFTVSPEVELASDEQSLSMGVSLPLPLWNRGGTERSQAQIRVRRLESERAVLRQEMSNLVREAQGRIEAARRQLALRSPEEMHALKELVERSEAAHARGSLGLSLLLEARHTLKVAEAARRSALTELALSQARIEAAVGVSPVNTSSEVGGN